MDILKANTPLCIPQDSQKLQMIAHEYFKSPRSKTLFLPVELDFALRSVFTFQDASDMGGWPMQEREFVLMLVLFIFCICINIVSA